jgi:hypothetical protein
MALVHLLWEYLLKLYKYSSKKNNNNLKNNTMTNNSTLRAINILKNATNSGFEINISLSFEDVLIAAEQYLIECGSNFSEEVELTTHGTSQSFTYYDGIGYEKTVTGEIIGYYTYRYADDMRKENEPFKHVVDTIVNTNGDVVELYVNI